jgi:hypothetical protein
MLTVSDHDNGRRRMLMELRVQHTGAPSSAPANSVLTLGSSPCFVYPVVTDYLNCWRQSHILPSAFFRPQSALATSSHLEGQAPGLFFLHGLHFCMYSEVFEELLADYQAHEVPKFHIFFVQQMMEQLS